MRFSWIVALALIAVNAGCAPKPATAAPAPICATPAGVKAAHVEKPFKHFSQAEFDFFVKTMIKAGAPLPPAVVAVYAVMDDPMMLIGFDRNGCVAGTMVVPVEKFLELLGAPPPKPKQGYGHGWDGEI